jgi:hypothetical protein
LGWSCVYDENKPGKYGATGRAFPLRENCDCLELCVAHELMMHSWLELMLC